VLEAREGCARVAEREQWYMLRAPAAREASALAPFSSQAGLRSRSARSRTEPSQQWSVDIHRQKLYRDWEGRR
jgi:hypothetical protein